MTDSLPSLTIVMPVRNEAAGIVRSVRAALDQDYPGTLEVVVAEGRSEDGTRTLVDDLAAQDERLRVVDNPEGIVPTGLNRAIEASASDLVMRIDGHCEVPADYARRCVTLLRASGADCAGGIINTIGDGLVAQAIATAQSSRFGVGAARFRTGAVEPLDVDTLAFGVYERDVFARLGLFDPELVRNQDDEFNLRLTQSGGRIRLDPTIVTTYTSRSTLRRAWMQYHQYGFFKVRVMQKRGKVPSARSLAPAGLVAGFVGAGLATAVLRRPEPLAAALVAYGAVLVAGTVASARRAGRATPLVPVALATLHVGYGTGSWRGLWHWRKRWGRP